MDSAYPAITDCAVTAAAMRAAAAMIEESGAGRAVGHLRQRPDHRPGLRAGRRSGPARRAGRAARRDRRHPRLPARQPGHRLLPGHGVGQARGIPVTIFTALRVRTRPAGTGPVPLAADPGGQVTAVPDGQLPAGWRWVTELDPEPAGTAPGQEAA